MLTPVYWLTQLIVRFVAFLEHAFLHLTRPSRHSMVLSTITDLTRSKADLVAENALLRQQLIVLHRQIKKPTFSPSDRLWLVLLASRVKNWKDSLLILSPTRSSVGIAKDSVSSGNSNRITVAVVPNYLPKLSR